MPRLQSDVETNQVSHLAIRPVNSDIFNNDYKGYLVKTKIQYDPENNAATSL